MAKAPTLISREYFMIYLFDYLLFYYLTIGLLPKRGGKALRLFRGTCGSNVPPYPMLFWKALRLFSGDVREQRPSVSQAILESLAAFSGDVREQRPSGLVGDFDNPRIGEMLLDVREDCLHRIPVGRRTAIVLIKSFLFEIQCFIPF